VFGAQFVVDPVDMQEIYSMFLNDWGLESGLGADERPPSQTTFKRIWNYFKKKERVRIRQVTS
jgi:hypothetical protein